MKRRKPSPTKPDGKFDVRFDVDKELKAIARERVGAIKPGRVIIAKKQRKKPKHKRPPGTEE